MERSEYNMSKLFAQLGQSDDQGSIEQFLASHSPMPSAMALHEAAFWTPAQACFLREAILEDAEWAEVVDELNSELHARH